MVVRGGGAHAHGCNILVVGMTFAKRPPSVRRFFDDFVTFWDWFPIRFIGYGYMFVRVHFNIPVYYKVQSFARNLFSTNTVLELTPAALGAPVAFPPYVVVHK